MRTLKASFLLIGNWDFRLQELGAHIATDLNQAQGWIQESTYDVVALSVTAVLNESFPNFFKTIRKNSPGTQWIAVVPNEFSAHKLSKLHQEYSFCRVISNFQDPELESHLFAALEEAHQQRQDENLALLIREQTDQLKKLQVELEERVQKRTRFLTEARRKLYFTNSRIDGFRRALMAVHEASSITEIETLLNESLNSTVQTNWIRLFYSPQDELFAKQLESHLEFSQLRVPVFKKNERIGSLFFMRAPSFPFTHEESDFLTRVTEAVSLALDRIQKLRESEEFKEQWEATFNSMSDPVLLIDTNYDIIQSNKPIDKKFDTAARKCYKWLYDRNEPCPGCQRGRNFRMQSPESSEKSDSQFEVFSQSLLLDPEKPPVFVNLYHDITQQLAMENQILETAKMAELGTIGSSIAHELNNPQGGILSFTQLIKMDMKPSDPLYQDIVEMEAGVQRCKEIVQNLLGFTRSPSSDSIGPVSLREVVQRALKILELQTKSQGIEVRLHFPQEEVYAQGHLNLLAQALKNILQNSIEHIIEKRRQSSDAGLLYLEIFKDTQASYLLVRDNGSPEKNPSAPLSLGVSVAAQILKDHQSKLEFTMTEQGHNLARITFKNSL